MNRRGSVGRQVARMAIVATCLLLLATPGVGADPAGPTDYETEIIDIEPNVGSIEVEVIGGDSFLQLTSPGGHTIEVVGYRGEPYLRFLPDGRVLQNDRSPSRWLNDDRYGDAQLPAEADHEAEPEWVPVADDGRFAWHDHRAHWMNTSPPPGATPDDVILEAVVPLVVDGENVAVSVRSTMLDRPSMVPSLIAAILAAGALLAAGRSRRTATLLLAVAVVAAVAGLVAYRSVPPETGPSLLLWALPTVAALSAAAAAGIGGTGPKHALVRSGLQLTAAVELLAWSLARSDALRRALIPSELSPMLDRAIIAAAGSAGAVAIVMTTAALISIVSSPILGEPDQGA